jgi:flagellar hook-associated protein 1 FlgK
VSGLFTSLTSASRALDAQRYGLDVAGQNIANVNTPGYARRTVDLSAVAPDSPGNAGRGVDVAGIRALRDRLLERRLGQEISAEQRETAIATGLSIVETALGTAGRSIDGSLDSFFSAFSTLADDPTSSPNRQEVLLQGQALAAAFRNMASRFETARRDTDGDIRSTVEHINSLTDRIAALNASMGAQPSPSSLHLQDEQAQLVRELSELVNITTIDRPEGGVDISTGNGRPLVVGSTGYDLTATPVAPSGYSSITAGGMTITSELTGGRLGGLLTLRDVNIPDYLSQLDTLAYEVAQRVNTLHTAGYDQTGVDAGDFFAFSTAPTGTSGAAAALIVNTTVAADARKIAAGSIAEPGDNQTARAIADLRSARVLSSNTATMSDAWSQLVYRVGRDAEAANDERDSRSSLVRQVDALRDEVSGVSLDEEAMHLLKFQRAYEANARFFRIIDESIETLLNELAR